MTICFTSNQSDSGSPAVEYLMGRAFLHGIVHSGLGCLTDYPAVFVQVSYFIKWIKTSLYLEKTVENQLYIVNKIVT